MLLKGAIKMKRILAIIISVAMIATMLAVSVSAESILGSNTGVLPENFTTETTPGENLNVKVSDVTHKYAVDVVFSLDDLTIGGTITWNVNTMKYEVANTTLEDTTRTVTVSNRSDLPVYAFATVTDQDANDGITVAAEKNSDTNKLTIGKANVGTAVANGTPTTGVLTINVTSGDWGAVAEYYAGKRLASANQATATFTIATVTVTITK
nr:MAG TPA: hypothetical protein [Caudoviricetes sp.]